MALNRAKLTDALVGQFELPEGQTDIVVWDTELRGFGLRVRPGSKTWIVRYRPMGTGRAGASQKMKIGTPESIRTAFKARAEAKLLLAKIATGADPLGDRRRSKAVESATLSAALDRYDAELERRSYVNRSTVVSGLRTKMKNLLATNVQNITGAQLSRIIEQLELSGRLGAAKDFRARARTFFTWVMVRTRLIDNNPLAGFRKERATRADRIAKTEHGRALSDEELVQVWRAADPSTNFGRMIRFYVLTGCRRNEAAALTCSMVDRPSALITFPADAVKQGRPHRVPIAPALMRLLDLCPMVDSELMFASARSGRRVSGWESLVAKVRTAAAVDFRLHDLRRTFRTGLSRLGVDPSTAELALGHARAELEQIYNKDQAIPALTSAFEKWAQHVETIVAAAEEKDQLTTGIFA